jgi:hypothetical protein
LVIGNGRKTDDVRDALVAAYSGGDDLDGGHLVLALTVLPRALKQKSPSDLPLFSKAIHPAPTRSSPFSVELKRTIVLPSLFSKSAGYYRLDDKGKE